MPAARRNALTALARAAISSPEIFEPAATLEASIARLRSIPGIGEWTAQYIALRGLHHPDAFPASDIGILRNANQLFGNSAQLFGARISPTQLLARSEQWRPWRGYAAQHLWTATNIKPTPRRKESRITAPHMPGIAALSAISANNPGAPS